MNRYGAGLIPGVPQQFMAAPRSAGPYSGMSDYSRQPAAPLSGVQSIQSSYRGPSNNQDFRQRDDDRSGNRFAGRRPGNRFQADTEPELDEPNLDESLVVLDHFNSDLHLIIDPDGYGGSVLNDPPGFCFTWAGARATYGACRGKVFYEVHIVEHLPADFGDDHNETDPHIVRLGWSTDSSSFQLGEEPWSYGYGGTGKFSTNNRFTDYGGRFEEGDVIGAMLDLESRPPTISYMKNGTWLGVAAPLHGIQVGNKEKALFPHVLSKNCRFKVNFGQMDAWYPPPMGFKYLGHLPLVDRVRGMVAPARKSDCEMIMIVGLPGAGKTTWGINMEKNHPEKRYNIIGTDTLIEKMRVMGLPRKRNYHGRWEVLIGKATTCLNKLFAIAAKRRRNYILDQTNVYATARRRKMRNFAGFYRIAAVIQPDDPELERRSYQRTHVDGKVVPESAVLEMKANYSIPEDRDNLFDRIDFVELKRDTVQQLVRIYNDEGKTKPRDDNSQNRFDSDRKPALDQRQQQYGGYKPQSYGQSSLDDKNFDIRKREYGYNDQNESAIKRSRQDSETYGTPKHQYEESDRYPRTQPTTATERSAWSDSTQIKDEPADVYAGSQWSSSGYSTQSPGVRPGAQPALGQSQYGTASQGYGSQFDKDSAPQQTSWQQEQKETSFRSQGREPEAASGSWQTGWKGRDDGQGLSTGRIASQDLPYSLREAVGRDLGRNSREADRNSDRDRGRDQERDRTGDLYTDIDRERGTDRNWDRSSVYNRGNSDRGGYGSSDRNLQDGGNGAYDNTLPAGGYGGYDRPRQEGAYSSNTDRTRQEGGYSGDDLSRPGGGYSGIDRARQGVGYDRTRPDTGYFGSDQTRPDAGYGGSDQTRPDVGYGGNDRTRPGAGYGANDSTRPDAGYGGSDRTRPDAGYGGSDLTRPDAGYGGSDRTRPDAGYGGSDRTRLDAGYGANDRTRPDAGYGGDRTRPDVGYGSDRTRPDAGYGGNDRTRPDAGYGSDRTRPDAGYGSDRTRPDAGYGSDRTRPDAEYVGYDRTRQDGAYSSTDRIPQDGGYGNNSRTRQVGEYAQDSAAASWSNQGYGAGSSSVRQSYDANARKSGNQQGSTSQWGLAGQEKAAFSNQIKQVADVDAFSNSQKVSSRSTEGPRRPSRFSAATHTDPPKALPASTGNVKTELPAAFKDSPTPDIRKSSSVSVLGQPGLKPLIPALERKDSDQIRKEKPAVESAPSQLKGSTSATNNSKKAVPPDNVEGRLTGSSEDKKPKPLASTEDKKPELPAAASASSTKGGISSTPSKEGPDKGELLPASDTTAAAKDPWNGPSNKPRGATWQMDRFPGPRDDMEARRPSRGPAHYGSFGGPPRGPMAGAPHGFRGPGPWNQNHPRFGPQGPPRPFFAGPPGRWPRPQR